MEKLAEIGQKHLFILRSYNNRQALFIGGSMKVNYVLLSLGILSCIFSAYIFKAEGLSFFFVIMLLFSLILVTSFVKSRRNVYRLIFDFDDRQVKLTHLNGGRIKMIEVADFSCFDALRIEPNIASPNFSVTKTVLVSLLCHDGPVCFLSKGIFGFSSIDDATQFAHRISKNTGWLIAG